MTVDDLRAKVLQAAIEEFADHGLSGARVDRIAQRAGANKQLIYYYFGDKDGLFDAAVRKMIDQFREVRAHIPVELADRPAAYFKSFAEDQKFLRILQWEALAIGEGDAVEEESRAAYSRSGVTVLKAEQKAGKIPADLDAAQLFLSFQALAAHPFAFPQMTRFITGRNASDPVFQRERIKFLKRLGAKIFS
jgi:TetR/AcrR family transcriptional regulator